MPCAAVCAELDVDQIEAQAATSIPRPVTLLNLISLINLTSLRDLEAKVGGRRHRRRFRANVWFSGAPPWSERGWIGQQFQMGGAVLRVVKGTTRCKATEVNPETGKRDADPVGELRSHYGHIDLGILAEVVEGGRFAVGDAIELLDNRQEVMG